MDPSEQLTELKTRLRESETPFFGDPELTKLLEKHEYDLDAATYEACIIKAQNTTLQVSGLSLPNTSKYFLRLASLYRPINTGTL